MSITKILSLVQNELKAPKGQYNKFGKYKYRSCEDIVEAVKPLLAKHGVSLLLNDTIVEVGGRVYIKAVAEVIMDERFSISACGWAREADQQKGMSAAQLTGTTSSYARKYALNGLFAIDDTKDDDTKDNSMELMGTDPIDKKRVVSAVAFFKGMIDTDDPDATVGKIKTAWKRLSNDEQMWIYAQMKEKAPGCNKNYSSLLKEYLKGDHDVRSE